MHSVSRLSSLFLTVFSLVTFDDASAQGFYGVAPVASYGLPNNIGVYRPATGTIETCILAYNGAAVADASNSQINGAKNNREPSLGAVLSLLPTNPISVRVDSLRDFNAESELRINGELPECSGTFDSFTGHYDDIVEVDGVPYSLRFDLLDLAAAEFELTSFSSIPEKADLAYVLRGYNDSTSFRSTNSFLDDAERISKSLV